MGSLSNGFILYILFIFVAMITGVIFWVIRKYWIPGVVSLILALLAPLLTLLFVAQNNFNSGAYNYITEEMSAGNTWARFIVIIHVYLTGWLLFLVVRGIIYLIQSPKVRELIRTISDKIQTSQSEKSNQDSKSS